MVRTSDKPSVLVIKGFPEGIKKQLHFQLMNTEFVPADAFKLLTADFVMSNINSSQEKIKSELMKIMKKRYKNRLQESYMDMIMAMASRPAHLWTASTFKEELEIGKKEKQLSELRNLDGTHTAIIPKKRMFTRR